MRPRLRIWTAAGALSLLAAPALAQQPVVEDLTARSGSGSFYDQTAAREPAGGNLELFNELQRNQEQLRQLRGQVEELRYQLDRLKRQTRQQYMDLDERLSANAASAAGGAGAAATEQVADSGGAEASGQSSSGQSASGSDAGARADYQAAFAKVQAREFDAATRAFESFVAEHPSSTLTANAYYWLGELHSAGGDLDAADAAFQRVLDDFPDSNKVPDTLYKLGLLKARQGDPEAGQALLERVQQAYPDSSAANLAADFQRQSGN
ncbi:MULTISPECIES: tol-pal system protein YbgF [Halomonas]|uniref:Cell division coordinator CpoB n=1 Tax=Halomonas halophila TaxID=29573 RepID=A0ABQ0TZP1_9GAMM|nr:MULTISPECIES: tol-pal system protein YbgF [Halomonas]MDR5888379.1 tol-pal system protein YbgF [Halomonas salina]WJY05725.1 tol-pal system protein YbgF [Halomonas halophila]GEK71753.1 tol-pal system protein YbgF [Halomonas halophila]